MSVLTTGVVKRDRRTKARMRKGLELWAGVLEPRNG